MVNRTPAEKQKIRELAQSFYLPKQPSGPSSIHGAIPANELPEPRRATPAERKILGEQFAIKGLMDLGYYGKPILDHDTSLAVKDKEVAPIAGEIPAASEEQKVATEPSETKESASDKAEE